jgi:hypothetical protein
MLPHEILESLICQVRWIGKWGGCPFEWNYHLKTFKLREDRKRWSIALVLWFTYTTFLIGRTFHGMFSDISSRREKITSVFILFAVLFIAISYTVFLCRNKDLMVLINSTTQYTEHLHGKTG